MFVHTKKISHDPYSFYSWAINLHDHYSHEVSSWLSRHNVIKWLNEKFSSEDFSYSWVEDNGREVFVIAFVFDSDLELFMETFGLKKVPKK